MSVAIGCTHVYEYSQTPFPGTRGGRLPSTLMVDLWGYTTWHHLPWKSAAPISRFPVLNLHQTLERSCPVCPHFLHPSGDTASLPMAEVISHFSQHQATALRSTSAVMDPEGQPNGKVYPYSTMQKEAGWSLPLQPQMPFKGYPFPGLGPVQIWGSSHSSELAASGVRAVNSTWGYSKPTPRSARPQGALMLPQPPWAAPY